VILIIYDFAVNEDLLVRSQRLHSAASTLAFRFSGRNRWPRFRNFPGYFYQLLGTCVADKTLGILIGLACEGTKGNQKDATDSSDAQNP
jgi:hypothetical protein